MTFSIVIPSLNAGVFLERALRSVLVQADVDTEVIVVDGGSTDGSVELLRKAEEEIGVRVRGSGGEVREQRSEIGGQRSELGVVETADAKLNNGISINSVPCTLTSQHPVRMRWVSEPDRGQSHALNKGFAWARGKYLFWVNADDLLLPGTLDRLRAYLKENPSCEWLAGNLVYIDSHDRILWCARDGQWHDWLYRHAPVRVYGPSSIFSRALFERVGGFDESLHYVMDTDLWLRFKKADARFVRLPHYFWGFRIHEGSKTSGDLMGKKPAEMAAEQERMYLKNALQVTQLGLWSQRLWRVINGCYTRAWWDTRQKRGCLVHEC